MGMFSDDRFASGSLAYKSDEGLAIALVELERIAPTITPDYYDPVAVSRKQRRRRR